MVMDYDSDSTEGDYTETNVLLGYASKDADEDTISKLGGHPVRPILSLSLSLSQNFLQPDSSNSCLARNRTG